MGDANHIGWRIPAGKSSCPIKLGKPGEFPGLATQSPEAAEESLKKSATGKHIISAYEKKKHSVDKA